MSVSEDLRGHLRIGNLTWTSLRAQLLSPGLPCTGGVSLQGLAAALKICIVDNVQGIIVIVDNVQGMECGRE